MWHSWTGPNTFDWISEIEIGVIRKCSSNNFFYHIRFNWRSNEWRVSQKCLISICRRKVSRNMILEWSFRRFQIFHGQSMKHSFPDFLPGIDHHFSKFLFTFQISFIDKFFVIQMERDKMNRFIGDAFVAFNNPKDYELALNVDLATVIPWSASISFSKISLLLVAWINREKRQNAKRRFLNNFLQAD